MTVRQRTARFYAVTVFSRADLVASGMTSRDIVRAVEGGRLRRLRRDRYAIEPVSAEVAEAVRIGGRLSCVSLLVEIGVFVHLRGVLHVHVRPGSSRVRPPRSKHTLLHWNTWSGDPEPLHAASLGDALMQAVRCQHPRAAVATLDSILHHGLMTGEEVARVFERLPVRFRILLTLVDSSAESGPETFMRLILRTLGIAASDILRRDSALREAVDAVVQSLGPHFRNAARAQLLKK